MSRDLKGRTYWLIGASEGLGRALAAQLDVRGARLILSARRREALQEVADGLLGEARVLPMDVSDPASVAAAAAEAGQADGVIYCVGLYDPMTAQDWQGDTALAIADANYMGALRVLGRIVPGWARRGSGHVVLIGSLAGYAGLPGAIGYASSKAALRQLGQDMWIDLKGTGVEVQVANPGFIKTRLTERNDFDMPQIMEPDEAAGHVMRLIDSPGTREISFPRPFSLVFTVLGRFLPFRLYARLGG